ncbi:MAG: hypothetical protein J2P17_11880 [Mycobacterium sp.]|nr:hypothetical protein [Mycobacterium sp.]
MTPVRLRRRTLLGVAAAVASTALTRALPVAAQEQPPTPTPPPGGFAVGGMGFMWDRGEFTPIRFPGATGTLPFGINARGTICGTYDDVDGRTHGFTFEDGVYTPIDHPNANGVLNGQSGTAAISINAQGQLVGTYVDADAGKLIGYRLDKDEFTRIEAPNATITSAFGLNNRGQITVQSEDGNGMPHDFLLDDGEFSPIVFPGAQATVVHKINANGTIVGVHANPGEPMDVQHGFILERGRYSQFDLPGIKLVGANSMSANGQLVGYYLEPDQSVLHGLFFERGEITNIDLPGVPTTTVYDINERGQLVGAGWDVQLEIPSSSEPAAVPAPMMDISRRGRRPRQGQPALGTSTWVVST